MGIELKKFGDTGAAPVEDVKNRSVSKEVEAKPKRGDSKEAETERGEKTSSNP